MTYYSKKKGACLLGLALAVGIPSAAADSGSEGMTVTVSETVWEGGLTVTIPVSPSVGVSAPSTTADTPVQAFTLQGVRIESVKRMADLRRLPKGIYIVNGRKYVVRGATSQS